jgi:hypothetical protein
VRAIIRPARATAQLDHSLVDHGLINAPRLHYRAQMLGDIGRAWVQTQCLLKFDLPLDRMPGVK